jgi:micrococcal nuclease
VRAERFNQVLLIFKATIFSTIMRLTVPFNSKYRIRITYLLLHLLLVDFGTRCFANPAQQISKTGSLPKVVTAGVISIQDGDTIELKLIFTGAKAGRRSGKPLRIRLLHVNCPERGKAFYKVAKQFTAQKCFQKTVRIQHEGKFDKYGRLLGEVILPDGKTLNKELVKKGYAVHFKKYSTSVEYARLEDAAKKQKLGLWGVGIGEFGKL